MFLIEIAFDDLLMLQIQQTTIFSFFYNLYNVLELCHA